MIWIWEQVEQPTGLYLRVTTRLRVPTALTTMNAKLLILDRLTQVQTHPRVIPQIPVTLKLPVAQWIYPTLSAVGLSL